MKPKTEALDSEHLFPIRGSQSSSWRLLFPSILITATEGPHLTCGALLSWNFHLLYPWLWAGSGSREEWSSNSSALLLYFLALYRSLCQPLQWGSESTWCHHVYHQCCLLGGKISGRAHVLIRQWGLAHQGANHIGSHFYQFMSYRGFGVVVLPFAQQWYSSNGSLYDVKHIITMKMKT